MLKPQDVVLLLKLLANQEAQQWPQHQLAVHLCISASEINAGFKRLKRSGLLRPSEIKNTYQPMLANCEEFLIAAVKYMFPAQLGEQTAGIPTSYAAPVFKNRLSIGGDPIPVWPYAEGEQRGFSLMPLYPSVPKSVATYPDSNFYDLLALLDAIRYSSVRERNIAIELLQERLQHDKP